MLQRLLAHEQDLADRGVLGVRAPERVLAGGAVDRGGLEQLPAVEDRLGIDARCAATGRADLEEHVRRHLLLGAPDAPQDGAGDDLAAGLELLEHHVGALQPVDAGEVGLEGRVARDDAARVEQLLLAAGAVGGRAVGVGEQALLADLGGPAAEPGGGRGSGGRGGGGRRGGGRLRLDLRAGAGRSGRLGVLLGRREVQLLLDLGVGDRLLLGHRVGERELLQMRVRVRVAVHVAQLDELAQAIGAAHLHDLAVLHRDHRRAGGGEDVDPLAGARRGDGEGRVWPFFIRFLAMAVSSMSSA